MWHKRERRKVIVFRKTIVIAIVVSILSAPSLPQQQILSDYLKGREDGERDAKGNPGWFFAGLGCGLLGVGTAYFAKPSPPAHKLLGKSGDYILGYTEGYQNESRTRNAEYAFAGWVTWVVFYLAVIYPQERY